MFTPRLSRRRHNLDTYIRVEVEEQTQARENASDPSRPASSTATGREAEENSVDPRGRSDRRSA